MHVARQNCQVLMQSVVHPYLQAFAQHSCGEVMRHELVVDEAHDTAAEEQPWKLQAQ